MADAPTCYMPGCSDGATVLHHVVDEDELEDVHAECPAHLNACKVQLMTADDAGELHYRREWSHPHPDA